MIPTIEAKVTTTLKLHREGNLTDLFVTEGDKFKLYYTEIIPDITDIITVTIAPEGKPSKFITIPLRVFVRVFVI